MYQGQKRGRAHEHDECENVEEESPKVHKGSTSSGVLEQDLDLDLNESGDETNAWKKLVAMQELSSVCVELGMHVNCWHHAAELATSPICARHLTLMLSVDI